MNLKSYKKLVPLVSLKALDIFLMLFALAMSLSFGGLFPELKATFPDLLQIKLKVLNIILLIIFIPIWHVIFAAMRLYDSRRLERGKGEWKDIAKAVFIGSMFLLALTVIFRRTHVNKESMLIFALSSWSLIWLSRVGMRLLLHELRRHDHNLQNLLLIGSNHKTQDFAQRIMSSPELGYHIAGFADDPPYGRSYRKLSAQLKYFGPLQDFDAVVERESIDEVVITLPIQSCYKQVGMIVEACELQGIRVHLLLSDVFPLKIAQAHATEFDGIPLLTLTSGPSAVLPGYIKRVFDVIASSCLVLILSPILLVIALLIKRSAPQSPIFFVQARVGYNRRRFKMIKFRTMVPDAERLQAQLEDLNEAQGPVFKIEHDPRITPLGRFLRKTSLDELPQLFNVIKGDMSLVGPRPLPLRDVARFEEAWLKRRFSVKPGITCLWQVSGRSNSTFDTWIAQDLEYIDNWSLGLDFRILLRTIPVVLKGEGAH